MASDHSTQPVLWDTGPILKVCAWCKEAKPLSEFYPRKYIYKRKDGKPYKKRAGKGGYGVRGECKQCQLVQEKNKLSDEEIRKRKRADRLARNFKITIEEYEAILKEQRGVCAICGKQETAQDRWGPGKRVNFNIDHCHSTGKVRGVLCARCNMALGLFGDDPDMLLEAVNYLENFYETLS